MKKSLIILILILGWSVLLGCRLIPLNSSKDSPAVKATPTVVETDIPDEETVEPFVDVTVTPAVTSNPMIFSGTGDKVIKLDVTDRRIIKLSYKGPGTLFIYGYGKDGNSKMVVAMVDGPSEKSYHIINQYKEVVVNRIGINIINKPAGSEDGEWKIIFLDPQADAYRSVDVPDRMEGSGPEAIKISSPIHTLTFNGESRKMVSVYAVGPDVEDMVITAYQAYQGEVAVPSQAEFLLINCNGDWQLSTE